MKNQRTDYTRETGKKQSAKTGSQPFFQDGFWQKKVQNRVFRVVHGLTKRVFVVTGHPTVHKWEVSEVVKDSSGKDKLKELHLVNWQSKKKLLHEISEWIENVTRREERLNRPLPKPGATKPKGAPATVELIKGESVKLSRKTFDAHSIQYTEIASGRVFNVRGSDENNWECFEGDDRIVAYAETAAMCLDELKRFLSNDTYIVRGLGDAELIVEELPHGRVRISTVKTADGKKYFETVNDYDIDQETLAVRLEEAYLQRLQYSVHMRRIALADPT
jgi:hypothetical protein